MTAHFLFDALGDNNLVIYIYREHGKKPPAPPSPPPSEKTSDAKHTQTNLYNLIACCHGGFQSGNIYKSICQKKRFGVIKCLRCVYGMIKMDSGDEKKTTTHQRL